MKKALQKIISLLLTALLLASMCACITAAEEADAGNYEESGKTTGGAIEVIMTAGTAQAFADDPLPEEDIRTILLAGIAAESAINQQPWFFAAVTDRQVMTEIAGSGGMQGAGNASSGGSMPDSANASSSGSAPDAPQGETAPGGDNASSSGSMPDAPQGGALPGGDASSAGSIPDAPQGETEPKDQNSSTPGQKGSSGAKASLGDSPLAIIVYKNGKTSSPNPDFDCGLAVQNMYIAAVSLGYGVKIVSSPTSALNGANHDQICAKLGVDPSLTAVAVLLIGKPDTAVDGVSGATTRAGLEEKANIVG